MKNSTPPSRRSVTGEALTKAVAGNVIEKQQLTQAKPAAQAQPAAQPTRFEAIQLAAYLRAERRGFSPGYEMEDWLAAEREVSEREGAGTIG